MNEPIRRIKVRHCFPLLHRWPDAGPPVEFLSHPHRHMMHLTVEASVKGEDREIEFFIFLQKVQNLVDELYPYRGMAVSDSCETIAETIGARLLKDGFPVTEIECFEDGENGARIIFPQ